MVVGEFTASNIAADQDRKEEEAKSKTQTVDMVKLNADIQEQLSVATEVGSGWQITSTTGRERGEEMGKSKSSCVSTDTPGLSHALSCARIIMIWVMNDTLIFGRPGEK